MSLKIPPGSWDKDINTPAIAVIRIPHISNFTDFAPLSGIEGMNIYFIEKPRELDLFKAVILPGSKNTCFDLNWLKKTGWEDKLVSYANKGGYILGICGGYQMMGKICSRSGRTGGKTRHHARAVASARGNHFKSP